MNNITAVAVQNGAQIIECAADIDVRNVYMPMLMRLRRLSEAGSFFRWLAVPMA